MIISAEQFKKLYIEKFEWITGKRIEEGTLQDKYKALAILVRDIMIRAWLETNKKCDEKSSKQVYYFSMEFLLGKLLVANLISMGLKEIAEEALRELGIELRQLEQEEPDAGIGNGGLGRLGACYLDSLASLGILGHGCGIRYNYGLFKQKIVDGYQVELPDNWLRDGYPWEIKKTEKAVEVRFGGNVRMDDFYGKMIFIHENFEGVRAVPYDIPIPGYQNGAINTLRLWSAEAFNKDFDLSTFNRGDYIKAVEYKFSVETITQILYPDDSSPEGKLLRLKQQYFLVSAGLQSIVKRYKKKNGSLDNFAERIVIHINDTHPTLCIPELMRILIDDEGMSWDEAWNITINSIYYTNHTIMPEALETWPIDLFKGLLPRIYLIIEEIDRRFRGELLNHLSFEQEQVNSLAILSAGVVKMANLAVVGSRKVNGVSEIHTEILKKHVMKDFHNYYPGKFHNITNGISHRRFLLKSNPSLAELISETIGSRWLSDPAELLKLKNFAGDTAFKDKLEQVRKANKTVLAGYIEDKYAVKVDPNSIFDVQVKRIHGYKRQLLNAFHILNLYNLLVEKPELDIVPRTFILGGKAAPGYKLAKEMIKFINTIAEKINNDQSIGGKIKVLFLENYNVSLAEMIIPATDLSEQISTASKEASGTGNMKFMMNGALTIGTMDGANIEIARAVGKENIFIFGLTVEEVFNYYLQGGYSSWEQYNSDHRLFKIITQLKQGFFTANKENFHDIYNLLINNNDEFFVLKDFAAYVEAQDRVDKCYRDKYRWLQMAVVNIAESGRFYSDRAVGEYAQNLWKIGINEDLLCRRG
ncbi:MAG: glycogen/starch/alpha-glucan phosphorylase [Peptococcaceae bacterium]